MRKLLLVLLVIFLNLIILGCQIDKLSKSYDKFSGSELTCIQFNHLLPDPEPGFGDTSRLYELKLTPCQFKKDNIVRYALIAEYSSNKWLFIENEESLQFLIDGKLTKISGQPTKKNREVKGGSVEESYIYPTDSDFIQRLYLSKEVFVKLTGAKGSKEYKLSDFNKNNFKEFYDRVVVEKQKNS